MNNGSHQWMQVGGGQTYLQGTDPFQEGGAFWAPLMGMAGQAATTAGKQALCQAVKRLCADEEGPAPKRKKKKKRTLIQEGVSYRSISL